MSLEGKHLPDEKQVNGQVWVCLGEAQKTDLFDSLVSFLYRGGESVVHGLGSLIPPTDTEHPSAELLTHAESAPNHPAGKTCLGNSFQDAFS